MNNKLRVGIVDDHRIVLDGLASLLQGQEKIELVFATQNPLEALDLLKHTAVDILITDIMMPEMSGLELSRQVKNDFPEIKILALSMSGEWDIVDTLINEVDVSGYALKNINRDELLNALYKIADGGIYFSEEVLQTLHQIKKNKQENEEAGLTQRELEILQLIEKEYSNKRIAETLFISERTVETHRKNILRKTGTNTVLALVKYAYQHKLI